MGWAALRAVFRSWEVHEREQLSVWMRRQGFPAVRPGSHISARAQEFLLSEACQVDGRVALLEAVYVVIAIVVPPDRAFGIESRSGQTSPNNECGFQLVAVGSGQFGGDFRIENSHAGRVRESFNFAFRERFMARLEGNVEAETRVWKLFGLIPIMLLHKPRDRFSGTERIGTPS